MTQTTKFSDFTDGALMKVTDIVVGLRGGDNTQFDFPGAGITDANGNLLLVWNSVGALAVNHPSITNSATTNAVDYGVAGDDANIDWQATAKGTGIFNFNATTALNIASGTTAQRPPTPVAADWRFNSDTSLFEGYNGSSWISMINAPSPTTDNAVARYNGTAGALQNSTAILNDSGGIYLPGISTIGTSTAATNSTLTVQEGISATNNMTDATSKVGNFQVPHYTNAEEPLTLIRGRTTSSVNEIMVGGGAAGRNTATQVAFYTAANNTTLIGTERGRFTSNGIFLVGTTAEPTKGIAAFIGAPNGITVADNMTDSADKAGNYMVPHYAIAEEDVCLIRASITSSENRVDIGGGGVNRNAATRVRFMTAANTTTLGGTERGRVDSSGNWLFNTTTASTNSTFNILNSTNGIFTSSQSMNDAASKTSAYCTPHYTNSEEPLCNILGNTNSSTNLIFIGGGISTANAATQVRIYGAANNTTTTGTEIARFSPIGLSFDAGSNYLDAYEENESFSPTFTCVTPGDLSVAYSSQLGRYNIIGDQLFFRIILVCTPTFTTASGSIRIGSFPNSTATSSGGYVYVTNSGFTWPASRTQLGLRFGTGVTYALLRTIGSAVGAGDMGMSNIVSGASLTIEAQGFIYI